MKWSVCGLSTCCNCLLDDVISKVSRGIADLAPGGEICQELWSHIPKLLSKLI